MEDALRMEQNIQRFHISESDILKFLDSMGGDPRDPETRRQLLDEYVSRIAVTGDTVAVSMNYTDDSWEFSIQEKIEQLDKSDELLALLNDMGRFDDIELSDAALEMMDSMIDPDDNPPSGGGPSGGRSKEPSGHKSKGFFGKQANFKTGRGSTSSRLCLPETSRSCLCNNFSMFLLISLEILVSSHLYLSPSQPTLPLLTPLLAFLSPVLYNNSRKGMSRCRSRF